MPQAILTSLHYAFLNSTQEELTHPGKRFYIFENNGNKPQTLDLGEHLLTRNGTVRCSGISSNNLHCFEIGTEPANDEQLASAPAWFKENETWIAPGIFISSRDISRTRNYAVYALSEECRPCVENSLKHYPHIFVREENSQYLTLVHPRDGLIFPSGHEIRIPEPLVFVQEHAELFWDFAAM